MLGLRLAYNVAYNIKPRGQDNLGLYDIIWRSSQIDHNIMKNENGEEKVMKWQKLGERKKYRKFEISILRFQSEKDENRAKKKHFVSMKNKIM